MEAYRVAQQKLNPQVEQQSRVPASLHQLLQSDIPVVTAPSPSIHCPLYLAAVKLQHY